jgi:deoxyadenosine/deoxycytidine kinase
MLYAHWEGFIKSSSNAYLEFVSWQKLPNKELTYNFIALSARRILQDASLSTKMKSHIAVTEFFLEKMENKSSIPTKNVINTKSNLTSSVLREITEILDFDYSFYAPKEKLIDDKLVNSRNNIAHGNYLQVDQKEFSELYEQVLEMMAYFSAQIDNAATLKIYSKKR